MSGGIVAIIDDSQLILDSLKLVLNMYGFAVNVYASPVSFLEDHAARPACLIVDQNMPGMKGVDLVTRLREDGNAVPVLLTTGVPLNDMTDNVARLDIERVLLKPVELEVLLKFVTRHC